MSMRETERVLEKIVRVADGHRSAEDGVSTFVAERPEMDQIRDDEDLRDGVERDRPEPRVERLEPAKRRPRDEHEDDAVVMRKPLEDGEREPVDDREQDDREGHASGPEGFP